MIKPRHEKLALEPKYSFVFQKDICPYYPTPWHYHPEFELVLVVKSTGQRKVGNHVANFSDGDLVFLGSNLLHSYKNDPVYYQGNGSLTAEAIVIHFKEDFLGKDFFNIPEMIHVNQLFEKAKFGLEVLGETRRQVSNMILKMNTLSGSGRVIQLLSILDILSLSEESKLLANPGFVQKYVDSGNDCITKVHKYIMLNFNKDIPLSTMAEFANMSIPSFCRYFKACTRKSFSSFLSEIRIGYACKLLLETDKHNISNICYDSGFRNMSNFNRQFKKITGKSPLQYSK